MRTELGRMRVEEVVGSYGSVSMSELALQRIWAEGVFLGRKMSLNGGEDLEVLSAGEWNRMEGPDFRGVSLRMGGRERVGDVEIHFCRGDWRAHGHHLDQSFSKVVLHVVLFPGKPGEAEARTADGEVLPELVLLPYLPMDLESHLLEQACRDQAGVLVGLEGLISMDSAARQARVRELGLVRWQQKVAQGGVRVERLGWEGAAHQLALETLGYRCNRAPMANLATLFPLSEMRTRPLPVETYLRLAGPWKLCRLRPANHPGRRIQQYLDWIREVPDWPQRLADWVEASQSLGAEAGDGRRFWRLGERREYLRRHLTGGALSGSRWDTVVVDALLPLAAHAGKGPWSAWWQLWFAGDCPDWVRAGARQLGLSAKGCPLDNGTVQGLIEWSLRLGSEG